jgi:peptidoglycan/xylan/chitin deacetylase (PgdA/CDA1 family)
MAEREANKPFDDPETSMKGASRFACLTYHTIARGNSQYAVSELQLRCHLALLKAEAYAVDGFEELEARLRSRQGVPHHYVVLTCDDGHESAMRAADLLEGYGFRATFFLTRDRCLKRSGFVRGPEIQELRRRGFSLGAHGTSHRPLTFLTKERCIDEIKESRKWLEDVLGEQVRYMAAPGGFINNRVTQLAHEHGYVLTGTCTEWMNSFESMNLPGEVNRVNVRQHFSNEAFRRIIQGQLNFYVRRRVRAASLWIPKQVSAWLRSSEQVVREPETGLRPGSAG